MAINTNYFDLTEVLFSAICITADWTIFAICISLWHLDKSDPGNDCSGADMVYVFWIIRVIINNRIFRSKRDI